MKDKVEIFCLATEYQRPPVPNCYLLCAALQIVFYVLWARPSPYKKHWLIDSPHTTSGRPFLGLYPLYSHLVSMLFTQ